ncbi:ATP-dependent Clp protease proteolytic subunit [Geodia barretti]|uniref:ATP-dependent Clp protease proteolytic subunit n=1 Tax=Geodia barretti TaxID=519541 RepID=A0AA35WN65_GEOBA|nr:ATP-dependent Clp protease proteolytic subunit [Geodia barretti]
MPRASNPSDIITPTNVIPGIIRPTTEGERAFSPYSLLLQARIIYLGTSVDDEISNAIVSQLLYLSWENPDEDISLYINSPGGSVLDGMAVYDTMQLIKPDVATICLGKAASMGAVLLSGGKKGKRYCTRNSTVLIHQPNVGSFQGQAADIEIQAREIVRLKERLTKILSGATGQTVERIADDSDRDFFLTAEEAVEYGLVDEILGTKKEEEETAEAA